METQCRRSRRAPSPASLSRYKKTAVPSSFNFLSVKKSISPLYSPLYNGYHDAKTHVKIIYMYCAWPREEAQSIRVHVPYIPKYMAYTKHSAPSRCRAQHLQRPSSLSSTAAPIQHYRRHFLNIYPHPSYPQCPRPTQILSAPTINTARRLPLPLFLFLPATNRPPHPPRFLPSQSQANSIPSFKTASRQLNALPSSHQKPAAGPPSPPAPGWA